ncbi:hypothetical protein VTI28DRAFT_5291 [Corynascus sepedonium]
MGGWGYSFYYAHNTLSSWYAARRRRWVTHPRGLIHLRPRSCSRAALQNIRTSISSPMAVEAEGVACHPPTSEQAC